MSYVVVACRLKLDVDVEQWCDELVQKSGILLLPATVYDHQPSTQRRHFRLGLGRDNFPAIIEKLGQFLEANYGDK